jgi:Holliday junction resolvasome RuvABC endonuclease subunit
MREHHDWRRALAVDPTSRGLGFAVLEDRDRLVDWGGKQTTSKNRNAQCVAAVVALVRSYEPDLLVLEDCAAPRSHRCGRVQDLIRELRRVAASHTLPVLLVSPPALRETCAGSPRATKREVALALAKRFPELARQLPSPRKPWMSEDARMSVFDAVALAVTARDWQSGAGEPRPKKNREDP